jgi:hypothetical protein
MPDRELFPSQESPLPGIGPLSSTNAAYGRRRDPRPRWGTDGPVVQAPFALQLLSDSMTQHEIDSLNHHRLLNWIGSSTGEARMAGTRTKSIRDSRTASGAKSIPRAARR